MPVTTDYYRTLEVGEGADADEIKRAYRRLARRHHPDRNPDAPGAEEQFKAVQEAYEVLSDPQRRRTYDRARRIGSASPFAGGSVDDAFFADVFARARAGESREGIDSLFQQVFSEEPRRAGRGRDVEMQVGLSFDQALRGGPIDVRSPDGDGLRLPVPPGVRSGLKVRLKGRGQVGAAGEAGDLYVTFRVEPSPRFRREGDDLHLSETVSAMEAILGTTRAITNAYGKTVKVQLPPGTQPGERLRLRGQGVVTSAHAGDLYVEVLVSVPRHLTDHQRDELEKAARDLGIL